MIFGRQGAINCAATVENGVDKVTFLLNTYMEYMCSVQKGDSDAH